MTNRILSWIPWAWAQALILICSLSAQAAALSPRSLGRGETWCATRFENKDSLRGWNGQAELEPGVDGGYSAALTSALPTSGATISRSLPVQIVRGCTVRGSLSVRARDVSAKPNSWNGIKCMLVIESPAGKLYPQAPLETGSFDWQQIQFTARIPAEATSVTLVLGLEQVTGKAWFDDLKFTVVKTPVAHPGPLAGPRYKGHSLPRLRGTMISPSITQESLQLLGGDWNANLIRWQLIRTSRQNQAGSGNAYDQWLESELEKLDAALPLCEKLGIYVVVDLHSPPGGQATAGGYAGSDGRLFTDKSCQDHFVQIWEKMASRYRGVKTIWGYDLANEPVEDNLGEGCADWQELAERTAKAIRKIDAERTIIVEPARWGGPDGLEDLAPIPVSNVVYSVHMYLPHAFTHQNVHGQTPVYDYPGDIQGKHWDKAQLKRALQPVVDFQNRYNAHIYIGEFSAIRWAPHQSAARYLKDLIEIFEENGWDWSYHAFREWNGWSVEHGEDPKDNRPSASPTDRQRLLLDWFKQNQKPRW